MFSTIFLQASPLEGMLPMLIMVGAMFLLFLWPQMRKQKKEKQFQEALKPGAKVVTTVMFQNRLTIFGVNYKFKYS